MATKTGGRGDRIHLAGCSGTAFGAPHRYPEPGKRLVSYLGPTAPPALAGVPLHYPHTGNYRETATCPAIETFVDQVLPADCRDLVWEILGDLVTQERSIQKAACLVGAGGNGKSTFLQLATQFVGLDNVCHVSLQRLERDRFAAARLFGKLANVCPDLPSEPLLDSAVFKAITGGDRITAEQKYRDSFEFTPFARLLFSANQLPIDPYSSPAYRERWLIIPFEQSFRNTRQEIPRQVLDSHLSQPNELSGALNRAFPALRRLRASGRFSAHRQTILKSDVRPRRDDP